MKGARRAGPRGAKADREAAAAQAHIVEIARAIGEATDATEALRVVCRALARYTGADTVGAHLWDRERDELRPVAGYHIPKHAFAELAGTPVPRQPFWTSVLRAGEVVSSDHVGRDPRFEFPLFRSVPHQSGAILPLVDDGDVAGTFYLVWWTARRRLNATEAATLRTIGQLVGLLVRNVRLIEEAELRRRIAEAAKDHYRLLFERNLAGVFRATWSGRLLECNDAFARLVGQGTAADAHRHTMDDFYASPSDRDAFLSRLAADGRVTNYELRLRRASGETVLALANAIRIGRGESAQVEGVVLDVTARG